MPGLKPLPTPETLPYWEAASRHELSIQQCQDCSRFYFYPRPFCPYCESARVEWKTASGRATLLSYIINHRPFPPAEDGKPVIIALVRLAEGPPMMTNIVGVEPEPENLVLDMELNVAFEQRDEFAIPVFTPAVAVAS